MIILANDGMDKSAVVALQELGYTVDTNNYTGDDLHNRLKEVDCVIIRSATKIRKPELDAGKAGGVLKLVIRAGVGMDNIDLEYAKEVGIAATNTPAASSNAVAELALGQMFNLARSLANADLTCHQGKWEKKKYTGVELAGKTLGLLGFGRIAICLAQKAAALGMEVIYTNRRGPVAEVPYQWVSLDELLSRSDYLSAHMPFAGGKAIIGKEELALMKKTAFIVNTARGGVVDEDALVDALECGTLAGAAVDVFAVEPLANQRLVECEKVILTPHIGAMTAEAQERIGGNIVDIIKETF